jgi:hypothetical protein
VETFPRTPTFFQNVWSTAACFSIQYSSSSSQTQRWATRRFPESCKASMPMFRLRNAGWNTMVRANTLQDGVQEQLVTVTENTQPRQIGDAHAALISCPRMHPLSCHVRKGGQRAPRNTSRCVMSFMSWPARPVGHLPTLSRVLLQSAPFRVAAPFPFVAISRISAPFSSNQSNQLLFRVVRPVPVPTPTPTPTAQQRDEPQCAPKGQHLGLIIAIQY